MNTLLVVDWDFFFPNPLEARSADMQTAGLYDWGHAEAPFFLSNTLWATRAASFLMNGLPLPGVTVPDGGWQAFWDRFTFADDAWMTYADSNMHAGEMSPGALLSGWDTITLLDAHHDSGYGISSIDEVIERGRYSCEDWMVVQHLRGCNDLTVRYPQWKPRGVEEPIPQGMPTTQVIDDGQPLDGIEFSAAFICRSGAWVPPWCDRDFIDFLNACPLFGDQIDEEQLDRQFTTTDAERMVQAMREQHERLAELHRSS